MKFPVSLSTAEPTDLEFDHYPECASIPDDEGYVGECDCEEETRRIRADFAEARYDLERGA